MYEVAMPKLSDSMEEGKIIAWKVKEGDTVAEGQVIAEIESDKAVMELESFHDGVLAEIRHADDMERVVAGEALAQNGERLFPILRRGRARLEQHPGGKNLAVLHQPRTAPDPPQVTR